MLTHSIPVKRGLIMVLLSIFMLSITTSCLTTKTSVGAYKETQGEEYTYAKGKQFWILWGIFPIGRTNVNTPASGDCEVITRFNVFDAIISGVTGGLITSYTIKVKAKR